MPIEVDPSPVLHPQRAQTSDVQIVVSESKHPFAAALGDAQDRWHSGGPLGIGQPVSQYNYTYHFPTPRLNFGQSVVRRVHGFGFKTWPPNQIVLSYTFLGDAGERHERRPSTSRDASTATTPRHLRRVVSGLARGDPRYLFEADIDASGFIDGADLAFITGKFGGPP